MVHGALLFCTVVLYTPHSILCGIALLWHPTLIVVALLSSITAFAPLAASGLLLRCLQLCGLTSETAVATCLLLLHFVLQTVVRLCVLHGCLLLQRAGWRRGFLLVRSRVPLVSLGMAVGAGFAGASLIVGGGALLAEGWTAQLTLPRTADEQAATRETLDALFEPSAMCAQLPRLVQSAFQQTFYTCGQVAWTVMLGQAYAAVYPEVVAEVNEEVAASEAAAAETETARGTAEGTLSSGDMHHDGAKLREKKARQFAPAPSEELARLVLSDETFLPRIQTGAAEEEREVTPMLNSKHVRLPAAAAAAAAVVTPSAHRPREEREAALDRHPVPTDGSTTNLHTQSTPSSGAAARAKTSPPPALAAGACHPALSSGLVVESVLAQRQPIALLTGLAALSLHLLYVLLPLVALSHTQTSSATAAAAAGMTEAVRGGCAAFIPLQCAVTLVSVVWGLWIVHCERHPSAYTRLA